MFEGMVSSESVDQLITVHEAADRLGVHPETIRRRIRRGDLVAVQKASGPTAPWLLDAAAIEHLAEIERRPHAMTNGVDNPPGRAQASSRHNGESRVALVAQHDPRQLFEHVEREMSVDTVLQRHLEQLDEAERIEAAAQELARRVRDRQRIRERALELLASDHG